MGLEGVELDSFAWGQELEDGSCEHSNKYLDSIKYGNFFDQLRM